jgi:hypothetical protein
MSWEVTPSELRSQLNPDVYLACFDDNNDGEVQDTEAQVVLVLKRSRAQVCSWLAPTYRQSLADLDEDDTFLLKSAQLDYAVAYSLERHPEYVRSFGEEKRAERWKRADEMMKRVRSATQLIAGPDNQPAVKPSNILGAGVRTGTYGNTAVGEGFVKDGTGGGGF